MVQISSLGKIANVQVFDVVERRVEESLIMVSVEGRKGGKQGYKHSDTTRSVMISTKEGNEVR